MEDIVSFVFAAFFAGLSATIPPGTIFTMTVTESAKHGFKAGFFVVLGHAIVEIAVVLMLTMGLGLLLGSDMARITLGLLGGGVLLWMGYDIARGAQIKRITLPSEDSAAKDTTYAPLTSGFIACIANPYFIVWWATVGGSFIVSGFRFLSWMAPIVFLVCHWASDFPWFCLISYSVSKGRRFLDEKTYRIVIGICGVFLLILGIIFLKDGLKLVMNKIF